MESTGGLALGPARGSDRVLHEPRQETYCRSPLVDFVRRSFTTFHDMTLNTTG